MTTRMLLKSIVLLALSVLLVSCSLFSSGEDDAVTPDQIDQSSIANADDLDDSDELSDEDEEDLSDDDFSEDDVADDDIDSLDEDDDLGDMETDAVFVDEGEDSEFGDLEGELDESSLEDDGDFEDIAADELGEELDDVSLDQPDQNDVTANFVEDAEAAPMEEVDLIDAPQEEVVIVEEAPTFANEVTNLEYKSFDNGGTVVIETTTPATYNVREEPDLNQVIVEVEGVQLPERFKRPYITKDFKQDVATINAYQGPQGSTARFVIQMKRPLKPFVQQNDSSILVMTSEPSGGGDEFQVAAVQGDSGGFGGAAEDAAQFTASATEARTGSDTMGLPEDSNTLGNVAYTGKKINLEVVDTDVREVVQIISEESGVNLIMDQDVKGKVSFRLRDVPWDQALMVVLKSQALGYKRQGNVLRIAKQKTLSSEAQEISKQIENEKLARLLAGGLKVKYIPVSYAKVETLQQKLKDFSSKEGKVTFDNRTSSIVISDYEEYIERISKLVKAMDIPPMQVEIEAKIIEAREDFAREVGINLGVSGQPFEIGGGRTGSMGGNTSPFSFSGTFPGASLDFNIGTFNIFGDLSATLNLFERQNKIRVLSSPKILAMNKVQSKILQNTQIPIQRISTTQAGVVQAIEFKDLVLSLDVTPQITFKGDVIMDVDLKREFAGAAQQDGNREINSRQAKTTVMVKNGETAVIGGIYQSDESTGDRGVPLLKDIPFIGALFRQSSKERQKNELLLFLKPHIITPSKGNGGSMMQADSGTNFQDLENLNVDEGQDLDSFGDDGDFADSEMADDFEDDLEGDLEGETL